ncbi:DUF4136 domain-containing protein [Hydrogenophaga sp.]|uniref:DUF4136 domain-containing protein n=1 Tax=Hydrogenophaga sp. TaxID=1904254 RepID=UPI00286E9A23|nr:DUF4136 domain-containing protein [Hydrogenophaga sp.]
MSRIPPAIRRTLLGGTLGLSLLLGGCASVYLVDNHVQSFAGWGSANAPAAPQTYRFERLPSQREGQAAASQDELEALARAALARAGWNLAPAHTAAPWTVQVSAGALQLPRAPWEDPWDGFGPGWGWGLHSVNGGWGGSMFMRMEIPYHERKVSLLVRQASTGQVVYETSARHDGRWNSSPELWSAMLDAALRDFPNPPAGARQVNVEVPR